MPLLNLDHLTKIHSSPHISLSLSLFWKPNLYTNPTTKEKENESSYKYPLYTMKKMSWLTVGILFDV